MVLWHYEAFALTVPVMVALLVTLVTIHLRLWARRDHLSGTAYWTVRAPWSVYLGWITVATITNVTQTLAATGFTGFGIEPAVLAALVLGVGIAIAATFVTRFRDVAYGLVIVWAYAGVAVKESDTALVAVTAGLGATLLGLLALAALARGRMRGARGRVRAGATA